MGLTHSSGDRLTLTPPPENAESVHLPLSDKGMLNLNSRHFSYKMLYRQPEWKVIERELKKPIKNGHELAETMVRINSIIKPASLDPLRTLFHKAEGLVDEEKNGSEKEVEEKKETEDKGEKRKPKAQENGGEAKEDGKGEKKAKASKAKEKSSKTEKEEEEKEEEGKKSPKTGGKGIDWLSKEESKTFFSTILPGMQKIALKLPELFKEDIPLLKQGHPGSYSIGRMQAACLVYTTRYTHFPLHLSLR